MRILGLQAGLWLREASARERRPVHLGNVSGESIGKIAERGFDGVWIRGLWEQEPGEREGARRSARILERLSSALPDLELPEIEGDPRAISRHEIRLELGGEEGLELLREDLARSSLQLLLDYSLEAPGGALLPQDLERVAALADGVVVFSRAKEPPSPQVIDAWRRALARVRSIHPRFLVVAETSPGLARELGADLVVEEDLRRALEGRSASLTRQVLSEERPLVPLLRRLEGPGETRARSLLDGPELFAASVVFLLAPGAVLLEDGQVEGRRHRQDPYLSRRREEPVDREVEAFHEGLLEIAERAESTCSRLVVLPTRPAWDGNETWNQLVVFLRVPPEVDDGPPRGGILAAVNLGPAAAQCYVDLDILGPGGCNWVLQDLLSLAVYERDGEELVKKGLYLDLAPWDYNVFEVQADGSRETVVHEGESSSESVRFLDGKLEGETESL